MPTPAEPAPVAVGPGGSPYRAPRSPLAIVLVALIALGVVPAVAAGRVRQLRSSIDVTIDPARRTTAWLEHAVSADLLGTGDSTPWAPVDRAGIASGVRRLDALRPVLDRSTDDLLDRLDWSLAEWQRDGSALSCRLGARPAVGGMLRCTTAVTPVIRTTMALTARLDDLADETRRRIRDVERWNLWLVLLLVPLALAAVLVVVRSDRRLQQAATEAFVASAALRRTADERNTLMRGVSHDVRNPLGAALGNVDLMTCGIAGPLTPRQRAILERIARLVTAGLNGVTALFDLSRDEVPVAFPPHGSTAPVPMTPQASTAPVPMSPRASAALAPLLRELVADFEGAAGTAGVRLRGENLDVAPTVALPHDAIRRILENLVSNAVKFTPTGGAVIVRYDGPPRPSGGASYRPVHARAGTTERASPAHGEWGRIQLRSISFDERTVASANGARTRHAITVSDTGPGIAADARARVFEESGRVSRAGGASGFGVGLSVSRRIARELGGDLTYEPHAGGGAVFALWLPEAPAAGVV